MWLAKDQVLQSLVKEGLSCHQRFPPAPAEKDFIHGFPWSSFCLSIPPWNGGKPLSIHGFLSIYPMEGNDHSWVPQCKPPGVSLEGSQQLLAIRKVRWEMAESHHPHTPRPKARHGQMLRKGGGIWEKCLAIPAISSFHRQKQKEGGNKNWK